MTGAEARKLTDEELTTEVESLKGRLYTLRTQMTTEKVEDVSQFRKIRQSIARLMGERSARRHGKAGASGEGRVPAAAGKVAPAAKAKSVKKVAGPKKAAKAAAPKAAKTVKAGKPAKAGKGAKAAKK
ncbi:MAG: 50S ribosomal protein L29 [Phycisphaerales bacterium]